jgi:hypothetical protein
VFKLPSLFCAFFCLFVAKEILSYQNSPMRRSSIPSHHATLAELLHLAKDPQAISESVPSVKSVVNVLLFLLCVVAAPIPVALPSWAFASVRIIPMRTRPRQRQSLGILGFAEQVSWTEQWRQRDKFDTNAFIKEWKER